MARTTPYSQLANILLFVPSALVINHYVILAAQAVVILCAILVFRLRMRNLRPEQVAHLLPVILFVCLINALKGGGEIVAGAGPLLVTRQGIWQGAFFSMFILELYVMSRLLTDAFEQKTLLHALGTIDRALHRRTGTGEIMVLLYHVLQVFKNFYQELRMFFRHRERPLRARILGLSRELFFRSLSQYEAEREATGIMAAESLRPAAADYVYVCVQAAVITCSFLARGVL
jgi:energy-coupling factor transporter transmembrane protein EcfT